MAIDGYKLSISTWNGIRMKKRRSTRKPTCREHEVFNILLPCCEWINWANQILLKHEHVISPPILLSAFGSSPEPRHAKDEQTSQNLWCTGFCGILCGKSLTNTLQALQATMVLVVWFFRRIRREAAVLKTTAVDLESPALAEGPSWDAASSPWPEDLECRCFLRPLGTFGGMKLYRIRYSANRQGQLQSSQTPAVPGELFQVVQDEKCLGDLSWSCFFYTHPVSIHSSAICQFWWGDVRTLQHLKHSNPPFRKNTYDNRNLTSFQSTQT